MKHYHAAVFFADEQGVPSALSNGFDELDDAIAWAIERWEAEESAAAWTVHDNFKDVKLDEGGDWSVFRLAAIDPTYQPRESDAKNDYYIDRGLMLKEAMANLKAKHGDTPIPVDEVVDACTRALLAAEDKHREALRPEEEA